MSKFSNVNNPNDFKKICIVSKLGPKDRVNARLFEQDFNMTKINFAREFSKDRDFRNVHETLTKRQEEQEKLYNESLLASKKKKEKKIVVKSNANKRNEYLENFFNNLARSKRITLSKSTTNFLPTLKKEDEALTKSMANTTKIGNKTLNKHFSQSTKNFTKSTRHYTSDFEFENETSKIFFQTIRKDLNRKKIDYKKDVDIYSREVKKQIVKNCQDKIFDNEIIYKSLEKTGTLYNKTFNQIDNFRKKIKHDDYKEERTLLSEKKKYLLDKKYQEIHIQLFNKIKKRALMAWGSDTAVNKHKQVFKEIFGGSSKIDPYDLFLLDLNEICSKYGDKKEKEDYEIFQVEKILNDTLDSKKHMKNKLSKLMNETKRIKYLSKYGRIPKFTRFYNREEEEENIKNSLKQFDY